MVELMTPEEFWTAMWKLREDKGADPESFHSAADELMCELLTKLGYGDGVGIFTRTEKWYA